jgi:hypothetical protein
MKIYVTYTTLLTEKDADVTRRPELSRRKRVATVFILIIQDTVTYQG